MPLVTWHVWLKSPVRSSAVGTFMKPWLTGELLRVPAYEKKKNVFLLRPSYTCGIQTGPPIVPPYRLVWTAGAPTVEPQIREFRRLFWLYSYRLPWKSLVPVLLTMSRVAPLVLPIEAS